MTNELYLQHHGILGQRWGKQNGPPYPLAVGQHSASEKKAGWKKSLDFQKGEKISRSTNEIVNNTKKIEKTTYKNKKDDLHELSDEELRKRVNRLRLEQEYNNLKPDTVSKGREKVREILEIAGAVSGIAVSAFTIINEINKRS